MARNTPLVCQHLEGLSSSALAKYADIIRDMVGRRHGVYALYRRDKLYYVGLASNLRNRLRHHLKDRHQGLWDRFSVYLTLDVRHMKELESLLLRIVKPAGNKLQGKFARSENLKSELSRRAMDHYRGEMLSLTGRAPRQKRTTPTSKRAKRLPLAKFVRKPMRIRGESKGVVYRATVRKDGTIKMGKRVFNSPSNAAQAALGHAKNGWWFWQFERAPGLWVRLKELKRRR